MQINQNINKVPRLLFNEKCYFKMMCHFENCNILTILQFLENNFESIDQKDKVLEIKGKIILCSIKSFLPWSKSIRKI